MNIKNLCIKFAFDLDSISRILLVAVIFFLPACSNYFFYPVEEHFPLPQGIGIETEDVWIESADNEMLHAWLLPAKEKAFATLIFAHGNAQNISTHIASVYTMPGYGINVLIFDYKGYGQSSGVPSIEGIMTDFHSVLNYVLKNEELNKLPIILFGQSLGGAVVISSLARFDNRDKIAAVIIDSTFTSFREIAREKLADFWLTWPLQWPLSLTVDDIYRPIDDIGKLSPIPILLIHSRKDNVIPFNHGEKLFDAAKEPKEFWPSETHGHIQILAEPRNQETLAGFIKRIVKSE